MKYVGNAPVYLGKGLYFKPNKGNSYKIDSGLYLKPYKHDSIKKTKIPRKTKKLIFMLPNRALYDYEVINYAHKLKIPHLLDLPHLNCIATFFGINTIENGPYRRPLF